MKNMTAIFSLLSTSLFCGTETINVSESEKTYPHHLYIGPEFLCYQINMPIKHVKVQGDRFFSGWKFGYEYLKPRSVYAGIDFFDTVSYVDFQATKSSWHRADRQWGGIETRCGYTFAPQDWTATPFLGIGEYDMLAKDNHNKQGFEEFLIYATAGGRFSYLFHPGLSLGLNVKGLRTFATRQRFKCEKGKFVTHHNMWGGEIGVPLTWHLGLKRRWNIQLEPYVLKIGSKESQSAYGLRLLAGSKF